MIRPVMMYEAEAGTVTRKEERLLERTGIIMMWCILVISIKNKVRKEFKRKSLRVAFTTDKIAHIEMVRSGNEKKSQYSAVRDWQKKRGGGRTQEDLEFL